MMLTRVVQTVITAVFFRTYFDLVNQFHLFQERDSRSILFNPLSGVSDYDARGFQAIHHAVQVGHLDASIVLIEQFGADINARTTSINTNKVIPLASTPLIISIITGNFEIFFYLLSKFELDVNASTDQLKSPLHFAAEHGHLVMIEALLDKGAKIGYLKGSRMSPFHVALEHGQLSVVEWFVHRKLGMGPVSSIRRQSLESFIHFLARLKLPTDIWIKSFEICLKGRIEAFLDRKNMSQLTPLQCAIEESNESGIIGLILFGADVSKVSSNPLIGAITGFFGGSEPISPEFINSDNETIWHLISRINSVALIKGILHFHPSSILNLRLINRIGKTALELAVGMENFEVAFEFLKLYDHQIDIDLLEKLVNISIWNYSPIFFENLIKEFPDSFIEISANSLFLHLLVTSSSMQANSSESKQIILLLIKSFPQTLRYFDKLGRTPLHLALECEFWEFFNWLREAKEVIPELDFNVQNDVGVFFYDLLREKEQTTVLDILNN